MLTFLNREIVDLAFAHQNLDGVKDDVYKFTPKIRYRFSRNLGKLKSRSQAINRTRTGLLRELGVTKDTDAGYPEFERRWDEFLSENSEPIDLHRIALADLNLDANQIPITVLNKLSGVIIDDEPAAGSA